MRYTETGFDLEVDLTTGNIEKVATDPKLAENYIGGLGTAAKVFWDRVPPEVDAFSPDNLLIFSTGLLTGTPAVGANHNTVTAVSPLTGLMGWGNMGSFLGPEIKFAGYDKIIIRGKSPELVYLWIHDNKVEIRDASHLRGKGAVETQAFIKEELNQPKAQVAAIGLAGENRLYYATIESDAASASRSGLGAVMGDKKLKAVAVRGTQDIYIARPAEFMKLLQEVLDYMSFRLGTPLPETMAINESIGIAQSMQVYDEAWHYNYFAWGNHCETRPNGWTPDVEKDWVESLVAMRTRQISCWNCPLECKSTITPPGQPTYMMKCFTKMVYALRARSDLDFNLKFAQRTTEYGLDSWGFALLLAYAVELYEADIITDKDLPGFPVKSEERFYYLLEKIVHREGIGDILAYGTYESARRIGKGAEKFNRNTIKKQDQIMTRGFMFNPTYFIMFATGEKLNVTQMQGQFPQAPFRSRKAREEFTKDWFQVPDEKFKWYFEDWQRHTEGENHNPYFPTARMNAEIVDWMERMHYVDDSVGVCTGLSAWIQKPPYHMHNYPKFISAGLGIDYDTAKLTQAIKRIRSLIRAINVTRGLRREDEQPTRYQFNNRIPEFEEELLDQWYRLKGFNKDAVPTKESLHELGLDDVAEVLIARGLLKESAGGPSEGGLGIDDVAEDLIGGC